MSIGTVAEWNTFAGRVNGGETTLGGLLTADLDFGGETFTIVGTSAHPFCGTFDGAGHTITGISVSKSGDADGSRLGLFGSVGTGGTVRNVTVTGSSFAGWNYVGGIAGYNQGGTVTGCHVTSSVTIGSNSGKDYHGGIVGYNSSVYSTVSHCTSAATVTNSGQTGCHYFGGIVGSNSGGTVENCLAVGATVSEVTVSNTTTYVSTTYVDFYGTYSPAIIYESGTAKHNLYLGADNTLYYPTAEGYQVNACRAYFQLKNGLTAGDPASAQVRAFVLNFGDGEETDGIQPPSISPEGERTEASPRGGLVGAAWYTLDGRRLQGKPTASGIYINNGRKVVVK